MDYKIWNQKHVFKFMIHLWIADIIVVYSELQILYMHDSIFGKFLSWWRFSIAKLYNILSSYYYKISKQKKSFVAFCLVAYKIKIVTDLWNTFRYCNWEHFNFDWIKWMIVWKINLVILTWYLGNKARHKIIKVFYFLQNHCQCSIKIM